ncbi:protein-L-isoaspartate(D-aspartate) O-methyltransferase [Kiloniella sp. b19]|uniref:protein-L-isoaspartate(D-aspartate) O-methyltransferase n=1 Tax=Kiloniella sp. GXU_MW_B19 TaxID=3141326 RepID=UPI0031D97CAC
MLDEQKSGLIEELKDTGITDEAVLQALLAIPRESFVPDFFKSRSYENTALPIANGQTLSQPYIVALMTQALETHKRAKVLEVGTGSGYQAAILSRLCRRVYTIERHSELLKLAEKRFMELRLHNVTTLYGDGYRGWKEQAPFDRIIVTAAPPEKPERLFDQLAIDGVMVLPMGAQKSTQELYQIRRTQRRFEEKCLGGVRFVPMVQGVPDEDDGGVFGLF